MKKIALFLIAIYSFNYASADKTAISLLTINSLTSPNHQNRDFLLAIIPGATPDTFIGIKTLINYTDKPIIEHTLRFNKNLFKTNNNAIIEITITTDKNNQFIKAKGNETFNALGYHFTKTLAIQKSLCDAAIIGIIACEIQSIET